MIQFSHVPEVKVVLLRVQNPARYTQRLLGRLYAKKLVTAKVIISSLGQVSIMFTRHLLTLGDTVNLLVVLIIAVNRIGVETVKE
jgi:hypothetical protein